MDVNCDENTFLTTVFCGRLLVALKKAIYIGYLLYKIRFSLADVQNEMSFHFLACT